MMYKWTAPRSVIFLILFDIVWWKGTFLSPLVRYVAFLVSFIYESRRPATKRDWYE